MNLNVYVATKSNTACLSITTTCICLPTSPKYLLSCFKRFFIKLRLYQLKYQLNNSCRSTRLSFYYTFRNINTYKIFLYYLSLQLFLIHFIQPTGYALGFHLWSVCMILFSFTHASYQF